MLASVFGNGMNYFFMLFLARPVRIEDAGATPGPLRFGWHCLSRLHETTREQASLCVDDCVRREEEISRGAVTIEVVLVTGLGVSAMLVPRLSATPSLCGCTGTRILDRPDIVHG